MTQQTIILQTKDDFQLLQYIVSRDKGPLDVTIAKHTCAQPEFRRRLAGFVDGTSCDLYRVEMVDSGGHGDQIGLQEGDVFVVCDEEKWQLGVPADLQPNTTALGDHNQSESYALNVLRDLSPSENDFDMLDLDHDEFLLSLAEEETTKEKTEESVFEDESQSEETEAKLPKMTKKIQIHPKEEFVGREIEADIHGYRLLEFTISDHKTRPFVGALVRENRLPADLRLALRGFLDETPTKMFRFRRLSKKTQPYTLGLRENDIFINLYKSNWYMGTQEILNERLGRTRPFRVFVLRKFDDEEESDAGSISETDQKMPADNSPTDSDQQDSPETSSPDIVAQEIPGYDIVRCHVSFSAKRVSFDAQLIEEECPKEFSNSTRRFFTGSTGSRCRFTKIKKNKVADNIGIQEGDVLLKLFKGEWYLGTVEDFQRRCKRARPFLLYLLRKSHTPKNGPSVDGEAGKKGRGSRSDFDSSWDEPDTSERGSSHRKRRRNSTGDNGRATRGRNHESRASARAATQDPSERKQPPERARRSGSLRADDILFMTRSVSGHGESQGQAYLPPKASESAAAATVPSTITKKRLFSGSFASKQSQQPDLGDETSETARNEAFSTMSSSESTLGDWEILGLLQFLGRSSSAASCSLVVDCITQCLESTKEVEKLVSVAGKCHTLALLDHSSEDIRAIGWEIVRATHRFFPETRQSFIESGLYTKIIQSLQTCSCSELFKAVVEVLVSPILGTDVEIQEFASIDGAIPSVVMAVDRQLGPPASYVSCCRFMANILASRRNDV